MRMVSTQRYGLLLVLLLTGISQPTVAQDAVRSEPVALQAGESRLIADTIGGFETVLYQITLRTAQTLSVALASNNLSNSFEIFAPGAAKPLFVSELHGNRHEVRASTAGVYTVKVFLLRLAARDYQYAQYELALTLGKESEVPLASGPDGH
jgi:hypothetical protein